ncbi:MAG TPA: hypothetical protein VGL87_08565, partial [Steroidobacteraceae bacterium]
MGKYLDGVTQFFSGIARDAERETSPRRRAILENYLAHAALEYTDRWPEIFIPQRTVEHPIYKVRWGTPEDVVYDGLDAVQGFYRGLKDDKLLTNQDQLLAVNDWGFASFLNINLFMNGEKAMSLGFKVDDKDGDYVLITPCGMYWTYDRDVRLIGEYVYEIGVGKLEKVASADRVTFADVQRIVAPHLPPPP